MQRTFTAIHYPSVVKPCSNGSSIGVYMVENKKQLLHALENLKSYNDSILIEEKICGREFSVGILGNKILPVIEIIPKSEFIIIKINT